MLKLLASAAVAASLSATPVLAAPAAPVNPAAKLSVAKAPRAGSVKGEDKLAGGNIIVAVLAVITLGGVIFLIADEDNDSDSN